MKRSFVPLRMALRELRRGRRRFVFFVLCIAIGVAGLVGIKGFNASIQQALLEQARPLMAADMSLSMNHAATAEQQQFLAGLGARGIQMARVTETTSMALTADKQNSRLVQLKAVDPGYPFYGVLQMDPPGTLDDTTALVGADLLDQLALKVGDQIIVGRAPFTISGVITSEPDAVTAGFSLGPRVMISQGGLDRTGIVTTGFRGTFKYLFKLANDNQVTALRADLRAAFAKDRAQVQDFRQANPQVARVLDRVTNFLSLLSLVALLVGGLGVANATRAYLQQKLDSIAIMKCVGATNRKVLAVYLTQMVILSLIGSVLGVVLGYAVQIVMPRLVPKVINLTITLHLQPMVALQGLAVGLVTSVLFTLLPLASVADIKPALVFRREMAERRPRPTAAQRARTAVILAGVGAGLVAVAAWMSGSLRWGLWFMAGLAVAVLVLAGATSLAIWLVRRIRVPRRWITIRQGLASLYRPGSQAGAVVLALGIGITMVLSVYQLQQALWQTVQGTIPPDAPNMVFININGADAPAFTALLKNHSDVVKAPDPTAMLRGRLVSIDGKTKDQLTLQPGDERLFNNQFQAGVATAQPEGDVLVSGTWWTEADWKSKPLVSVDQEMATRLNLRVGSTMEAQLEGGTPVTATVFNIRKTTNFRAGGSFNLMFAPGVMDPAKLTYYGQANVKPGTAHDVQRDVSAKFPGITVIDVQAILATVTDVVNRVGLVIRFVAGFTVLAGLLILASSIATTKFRRTREAVLYKTLGATRGKVWRIFATEYAVLGLTAGAVSAFLAAGTTWAVLKYVMEISYRPDWGSLIGGVAISLILTVIVGVVSTLDVLSAKPLQVLREE